MVARRRMRCGRAAAALAVVAVVAAVMARAGTAEAAADAAAAGGRRARGRALQGERNHSYKKGEEVKLYANKVGPFHNPR